MIIHLSSPPSEIFNRFYSFVHYFFCTLKSVLLKEYSFDLSPLIENSQETEILFAQRRAENIRF